MGRTWLPHELLGLRRGLGERNCWRSLGPGFGLIIEFSFPFCFRQNLQTLRRSASGWSFMARIATLQGRRMDRFRKQSMQLQRHVRLSNANWPRRGIWPSRGFVTSRIGTTRPCRPRCFWLCCRSPWLGAGVWKRAFWLWRGMESSELGRPWWPNGKTSC